MLLSISSSLYQLILSGFRGSALSRRMRDRETEAESDHRDKQREMEEIDEILRKRLTEPPTEKENEVAYCIPRRPIFVTQYSSFICMYYPVVENEE